MVSDLVSDLVPSCLNVWTSVLLAETAAPATLLERLSPVNQLRVIMGLFVIVILGVVLFIVIKAGAHMVQGMSAAANRLRSDSAPAEDDWASKPLNESYRQSPDERNDEPPADTANGG